MKLVAFNKFVREQTVQGDVVMMMDARWFPQRRPEPRGLARRFVLPEHPYQKPELGQRVGPTLCDLLWSPATCSSLAAPSRSAGTAQGARAPRP